MIKHTTTMFQGLCLKFPLFLVCCSLRERIITSFNPTLLLQFSPTVSSKGWISWPWESTTEPSYLVKLTTDGAVNISMTAKPFSSLYCSLAIIPIWGIVVNYSSATSWWERMLHFLKRDSLHSTNSVKIRRLTTGSCTSSRYFMGSGTI